MRNCGFHLQDINLYRVKFSEHKAYYDIKSSKARLIYVRFDSIPYVFVRFFRKSLSLPFAGIDF